MLIRQESEYLEFATAVIGTYLTHVTAIDNDGKSIRLTAKAGETASMEAKTAQLKQTQPRFSAVWQNNQAGTDDVLTITQLAAPAFATYIILAADLVWCTYELWADLWLVQTSTPTYLTITCLREPGKLLLNCLHCLAPAFTVDIPRPIMLGDDTITLNVSLQAKSGPNIQQLGANTHIC